MLSPFQAPRKRRTRQHIIADLSVHHVEGFILEEGHTAERTSSDYGYDLTMWIFDESAYPDTDFVRFQIKASDALKTVGEGDVAFDVHIRDYNLVHWRTSVSRFQRNSVRSFRRRDDISTNWHRGVANGSITIGRRRRNLYS